MKTEYEYRGRVLNFSASKSTIKKLYELNRISAEVWNHCLDLSRRQHTNAPKNISVHQFIKYLQIVVVAPGSSQSCLITQRLGLPDQKLNKERVFLRKYSGSITAVEIHHPFTQQINLVHVVEKIKKCYLDINNKVLLRYK